MGYWIAAAMCAFFVKGLCGFANTLVFTSILSFGVNNVDISPVELLMGFPANLLVILKERRHLRWRICLPLAGMVMLGCVPGALFLKRADARAVKLLCGAVIVLVGLEMLFRERRPARRAPSRAALVGLGLLSGVLCGLYGIGALASVYISRVTEDSHAFKANVCMVFFWENLFRIILYTAWGVLGTAQLTRALTLLPCVLAGLGLGMLVGRMLDEKRARYAVVAALVVSGVALILNSL